MAIWARQKEGRILPGPKAADARQAGSGEGDGAGRGQVERGSSPPASTSKGFAPSAGRELVLRLIFSHPSCSLNKSLNPTRCAFKRKMIGCCYVA